MQLHLMQICKLILLNLIHQMIHIQSLRLRLYRISDRFSNWVLLVGWWRRLAIGVLVALFLLLLFFLLISICVNILPSSRCYGILILWNETLYWFLRALYALGLLFWFCFLILPNWRCHLTALLAWRFWVWSLFV